MAANVSANIIDDSVVGQEAADDLDLSITIFAIVFDRGPYKLIVLVMVEFTITKI